MDKHAVPSHVCSEARGKEECLLYGTFLSSTVATGAQSIMK